MLSNKQPSYKNIPRAIGGKRKFKSHFHDNEYGIHLHSNMQSNTGIIFFNESSISNIYILLVKLRILMSEKFNKNAADQKIRKKSLN